MSHHLKLLAVLAHPDDESLGFGGTLAKYAAEGVETYLVTATRGGRGRFGARGKSAPPEEVGTVREAELRSAAKVLGLREVSILGYPDGAVDQVDPGIAIGDIVQHIRRIRPHVAVSFGPEGAYGHPDHIAVSQFLTAAVVCAADAAYAPPHASPASPPLPHRVAKLYHLAWHRSQWDAYQSAFRKLTSLVDGVERQAAPWPDWAVTTEIDTAAYWPVVWEAVCCHQTQISIYEQLAHLSEERRKSLWGSQSFYRACSTVNGGRARESGLFEGLR